jgi:hypothetical protein
MSYTIEFKGARLSVEVDSGPPEPDVGIMGNGSVAISVEDVLDGDGNSLMDNYSPMDIDDIAEKVYEVIAEGGFNE